MRCRTEPTSQSRRFTCFRYRDEQTFRYNDRKDENGRKLTEAERFSAALSQIVGKRLTFAEVTGKVGENQALLVVGVGSAGGPFLPLFPHFLGVELSLNF